VGVATQNPELRARFTGKPEFVENFFEFIATEVRELMAALGFRSMAEMIGHVEVLDTRAAVDHWKAAGLDLSPILAEPQNPYRQTFVQSVPQDHGLDHALDVELIARAAPALENATPVVIDLPIRNVNRTVGTMLGHEITKRWPSQGDSGGGLPDGTIDVRLTGSAGQSFGAFVPRGVTLRLVGDANDYLGKGLSGGRIIVRPHPDAPFVAEDQVIAGNVIGYGATAGEIFLRGVVGERFCVRNSGALAVAEGVGDHGCEYMTGGRVVVLGPTGLNFGAGMSGGIAYVYDAEGTFASLVNREMVALEELTSTDREEVREIVARHEAFTESAVARRLLAEWEGAADRFVKVMPLDYKRVLEVMAVAESEGLDEPTTLQRVMQASHG
jgi:glutamate synthase (NADPH/NADH) large chain